MRRIATLGLLLPLIGSLSVPIAGQSTGSEDTASLSLEGKTWSLLVDLPKFKIEERKTRPDGSGTMIRGASRKTDVVVSVFLERAPNLQSMEECKEYYWGQASRSPLPKSEIKHEVTGSMALVHWLVKEFQGISVMQKNVNAYLYRDGVCVDIHLSKVEYKAADDALFTAVLDSVRYSNE